MPEIPVHAEDVLEFLGDGEVVPAILTMKRLTARTWNEKAADGGLEGAPESFRHLLKRRGYFVSTAGEVAQTLEEIAAMGAGFDLHDLAQALAEYDTTLSLCLRVRRSALFPELRRFAVICPCGTHGKSSR